MAIKNEKHKNLFNYTDQKFKISRKFLKWNYAKVRKFHVEQQGYKYILAKQNCNVDIRCRFGKCWYLSLFDQSAWNEQKINLELKTVKN